MTYGIRSWGPGGEASGTLLLDINDSTVRFVSVQDITVPSSGTTTVTVSSTATVTNAVAVVDNGASATVTNTGEVTVTGSTSSSGTTKLRLQIVEL